MLRITILLLFSFLLIKAKGGHREDYYNLTFSKERVGDEFRWLGVTDRGRITADVGWDSTVLQGRSLLYFREMDSCGLQKCPLFASLFQRIGLHDRNARKAQITLRSRSAALKEGWLIVTTLNQNEAILCEDSVDITGNNWHESRLNMSLKDVFFLRLTIVVRGNRSTGRTGAEVLFDRLDIRLDGSDIDKVNTPDRQDFPPLEIPCLRALSFSDDSSWLRVDILSADFKVLGLGESMHGCRAIGEAEIQAVKTLVRHRNCKLIMMELPSMLVLTWDLYIQGLPIPFSEIENNLLGCLFPAPLVHKLLDDLRDYNRSATRKVHIVGIDKSRILHVLYMHDYLYALYQKNPVPFMRSLLLNYNEGTKLLELMAPSDGAAVMGNFDFYWYRQLVFFYYTEQFIPGVKEYGSENFRDFIMWEHAKFALKAAALQETETAVVIGHWLHLEKLGGVSAPYPSLGHYFVENLGKQYRVIGIAGGQGTHNSLKNNVLVSDVSLKEPPVGTFERLALQTGIEYFYSPLVAIPSVPLGGRVLSTAHRLENFQDFAFPARVDGMIFIRDCSGIPIQEGLAGRKQDIVRWVIAMQRKIAVRNSQLKE